MEKVLLEQRNKIAWVSLGYQPNNNHGKNDGLSDITEKNNTDPHRK